MDTPASKMAMLDYTSAMESHPHLFEPLEEAPGAPGAPEDPFAELAVVGVSEDGIIFTEFTCEETEYPFTGCAGWNVVEAIEESGIDPFDPAVAGGDQFDLADIGVEQARYIRIRDINDESMGTDSFGFDLDAISVVNGVVVE